MFVVPPNSRKDWETVAFSVLVLVNLLCHDLTPQEASDPQPTAIDERAEPWRAAVEKAMQAYVKEHYSNGVLTVSGLGHERPVILLLVACVCIVSKYNSGHGKVPVPFSLNGIFTYVILALRCVFVLFPFYTR